MYKNSKEFLKQELIKEAEAELQDVQNDQELRKLKAPESIRERLIAEIDAREANEAERVRTDEEEKLIEIGRLYIRRQKRYKYLVVALVAMFVMACGLTAMGGPRKIVEDIRRMMMGRTQIEIDVDSKNIEPIEEIDEETGYQMVKDKWGVEAVRSQYCFEDTFLKEFHFNEALKVAQFTYTNDGKTKVLYQITPNQGTVSQGNDVEDVLKQEYVLEVQGQEIHIKEFYIEEQNINRWTVDFSYQNLYYFMWITDENQSNLEKIVKNLKFF